jgi:putative endonuclease
MTAVSTHTKGALGEEAAASWLQQQGWSLLSRNYRTRTGEIDIIAQKGETIAFVEVKAWGALPRGELERSIDARKRARIVRAARGWLAGRPELQEMRMRFDVVFLDTRLAVVDHIEDAFGGEGSD